MEHNLDQVEPFQVLVLAVVPEVQHLAFAGLVLEDRTVVLVVPFVADLVVFVRKVLEDRIVVVLEEQTAVVPVDVEQLELAAL